MEEYTPLMKISPQHLKALRIAPFIKDALLILIIHQSLGWALGS